MCIHIVVILFKLKTAQKIATKQYLNFLNKNIILCMNEEIKITLLLNMGIWIWLLEELMLNIKK